MKIEKKNLVILFFATFLVFNLNLSFFSNFNSGDTIGAKLLPFQILSGRGIFFDQYAQAVSVSTGNNYFFSHSHDHTVSNYPLLTGILAIPFYLPVYSYLAFTGQANIELGLRNPELQSGLRDYILAISKKLKNGFLE